MAKQATSDKAAPGERKRSSIERQSFQKPKGLRVEPESDEQSVVVSFPVPTIDWQARLTRTEAEIVEDVLAGLGNAAIAAKRGSALRTVANQVASVYKKLGVRSRLQLSLYTLTGRHTFPKR